MKRLKTEKANDIVQKALQKSLLAQRARGLGFGSSFSGCVGSLKFTPLTGLGPLLGLWYPKLL